MTCPSCGAPMRLQDGRECLTCEYCKTEYFPEKNEDGVRVLGEPTSLNCPACATPLVHASIDRHRIQYCTKCRGAMLSMEVFTYVVQDMRAQRDGAAELVHPPDPRELRRRLNCPQCKHPMDTHYYAGGGNVVIDDCSRCGLVWLDSGELMTIIRAPDYSSEFDPLVRNPYPLN